MLSPHLTVPASGAGRVGTPGARLAGGSEVAGRTADPAPLHAEPGVQVGALLRRPPLRLDLLLRVIGQVVTLGGQGDRGGGAKVVSDEGSL